jgi:hypothetical protein
VKKQTLNVGDIVQLSPFDCRNKMFGGCMMVVTEPKEWGAQGYVQGLGEHGDQVGQAYYRAKWEEMEPTGGIAQFIVG